MLHAATEYWTGVVLATLLLWLHQSFGAAWYADPEQVRLALRDEPRRFEDLSFDQQEKYRTYAAGERYCRYHTGSLTCTGQSAWLTLVQPVLTMRMHEARHLSIFGGQHWD